ncbi:MAG: hypothetical protein KY469_00670 [Actinobacteria bacterium]|nr:hypothetical protein [Actinomycetota bacterium]
MVAPWDRRTSGDRARIAGEKLRTWLPEVAAASRFWAEWFRVHDVDVASIEEVEDLTRLPTAREAEVVHAGGPGGPDLVLRPSEDQVKARASGDVLRSIAERIRSAGAEGKRRALLEEYKPIHLQRTGRDGLLTLAYSRSDLDRLHLAGARAAAVLGLSEDDYVVSAVPASPTLAFWGTYHLALGASLLALHPRGSGEPADTVSESFGQVPATAVAVPVAEAISLAAAMIEHGVDLSTVRTLLLLGPPPQADQRARIEEAWLAAGTARGLRVLALWGPSGARALWAECSADNGLHTYPDLEFVEVIDPSSGRPAREDGDLTLTNVGWHGTVLVRYQTGAYVSGVTDAACPGCGRTVPRVSGEVIEGAWEPAITTEDGVFRADLRGAAVVLGVEPGITAWRTEVRPPKGRRKTDQVLVEAAPPLDETVSAALEERLEAAVGVPVTLAGADAAAVQRNAQTAGSVFADLR